jgi:hypothetical protein
MIKDALTLAAALIAFATIENPETGTPGRVDSFR